MFQWYQQSTVCYAYLSDVSVTTTGPVDLSQSKFSLSRWFTRGWTLQELIAPSEVIFWSAEWHYLGTRAGLGDIISSITGIETKFLAGADLYTASTAKKMYWASYRQTARLEDRAYSLLGIFDVNMPLIYGEGAKAFRRLQEEILRVYPEDHSIFAWGNLVEVCTIEVKEEDPFIPGTRQGIIEPLLGLLAESPLDFAQSGGVTPLPWAGRFYTTFYESWQGADLPMVVGKTVKLELPEPAGENDMYCYNFVKPAFVQGRPGTRAGLLCETEKYGTAKMYIPLLEWGSGYLGRTREFVVDSSMKLTDHSALGVFRSKRRFQVVPERRKAELETGDIVIRQMRDLRTQKHPYTFQVATDRVTADLDGVVRVFGMRPGSFHALIHTLSLPEQEDARFSIILSRYPRPAPGETLHLDLHIGITRLSERKITPKRLFQGQPTHEHTFSTPFDEWNLYAAPFPPIFVSVERVEIEEGSGSFVDLVDIMLRDPIMQPPLSISLMHDEMAEDKSEGSQKKLTLNHKGKGKDSSDEDSGDEVGYGRLNPSSPIFPEPKLELR
jgi:hypothetical protein